MLMLEPMLMFMSMFMFMLMFESMLVEALVQLMPVVVEPAPVAMDMGAVPVPPPPQAARVVSTAIAAHSGAAGNAWRSRNALDMWGPPLWPGVSVRRGPEGFTG
jgi:hypothetical protein